MNTNKTLKTIIQILLFIVPFVVLNLAGNLYFPYITGKAFIFRTIIVVATTLYAILVIRDRSFLPRKSVIIWCLSAFAIVLAISTITSIDPAKSFWSNYERMEGYVTILHLFAFFIISSSVLTGKQWFWLLHTSLFASIITGLYAYSGLSADNSRISGTLGNSSYLGVYALVHVFIAGAFLLGVIEKKSKSEAIPWVFGYLILIVFNGAVLFQTGTRGSFAGLIGGIFVASLLLVIFEKKTKTIKYFGGIVLAIMVVTVLLLGSFKNSDFVKKSNLLNRFGSLITTDIGAVLENQGYARTVIWSIAGEGFKERPILGWGQDNFGYVFAKYYDPRMYAQEQWFDRSHNVFMDWLVAGGILTLLGYLALFFSAIYMMWRKNPHMTEPWSVSEKAVLTGLFVGYFIHNLFVFDNLISYILFFTLIAYIHERSVRHTNQSVKRTHLIPNGTGQIASVIILAVLGAWALNSVVVKPYMQGVATIEGLRSQNGSVDAGGKTLPADPAVTFGYFKKALSYNSFGNEETSERMLDVASAIVSDANAPSQLKAEINQYVQDVYGKLLIKHAGDPRYQFLLGLYFEKTGMYDNAIKYYKEALALSPKKQSFMYQVAFLELNNGNKESAIKISKQAYEEFPSNVDALSYYIYVLIKTGDFKTVDAIVKEKGVLVLAEQKIFQALVDTKQSTKIVEINNARIAQDPMNPQLRLSVAATYLQAGNKQMAISEIRETIRLAPEFKDQGEFYIKEIQAGRNPAEN